MIATVHPERVLAGPDLCLRVEDQVVPLHAHRRLRGLVAAEELEELGPAAVELLAGRLGVDGIRGEAVGGLARVPLGRWGTPDEIAKIAVILCSDASAYITGETVIADGGYVIG